MTHHLRFGPAARYRYSGPLAIGKTSDRAGHGVKMLLKVLGSANNCRPHGNLLLSVQGDRADPIVRNRGMFGARREASALPSHITDLGQPFGTNGDVSFGPRAVRSQPAKPAINPADLAGIVHQVLSVRGHELLGEATPPSRVDLSIARTAIAAELRFSCPGRAERTHRVVVKSTASNLGIRSANELARVVAAMTTSSAKLGRSFPRVVGFDERAALLVLGYVKGSTLDSSLHAGLKRPASASTCGSHLRQAAVALSCVQELTASDFMSAMPVRNNGSFVPSFEDMASPLAPLFRKAGFAAPAALLDRLTAEFFAREADRMFLIDARPKNIIVRASGGLCFIDLDCAPGPPGLGVASFLVAVDRIGSRYPLPSSQRRVAGWKQTFVRAYAERSGGGIGEDLTFFYPWTLLQMFRQHAGSRPHAMPYLRWYYGRCLAQFLKTLSGVSPSDVTQNPGALFPS